MKFYHGTDIKNLGNISLEGIKPLNMEKQVYLADTSDAVLAFMVLRGVQNFVVFEVELEENLVEPSYDHSEHLMKTMFKLDSVKCYTYDKTITLEEISIPNSRIYNIGEE